MSAGEVVAMLFWIGACGTMYAYAVFPAAAAILAARRRPAPAPVDPNDAPHDVVTVIIPAYNEERHIGDKIRNVLGADYPRQLLDVIVVSDASTDGTDGIVRTFAGDSVRLVVQETRSGKTAGLNRAMALARGSLIVFTDANAAYQPDTISTLVRYFQRPRVGMVTGYTRYRLTDAGEVAEATNLYTALEREIKKSESAWGCCVGADGAIFAIRASLYRPLRDDDINDFVIPLDVIEQGYQCVLAEDAFCSENPGTTLESEFRRQSRITNRTLRALFRRAHLLNPFRFPSFSFFLFSHKLARFLVPMFLVVCLLSLAILAPGGGVYFLLGIAALLVFAMAAVSRAQAALGIARIPLERLFRFVNVFVIINLAVLHGWFRFLTGHGEVTWQHDRSTA